jgi:hypothetical protein
MNKDLSEIIDQIRNECENDEQFDLVIIASILELSNIIDKEEFYKDKLIELKEEPYESKFPLLYQYLIDLSEQISEIEKVDKNIVLLDTLEAFLEAYSDLEEE